MAHSAVWILMCFVAGSLAENATSVNTTTTKSTTTGALIPVPSTHVTTTSDFERWNLKSISKYPNPFDGSEKCSHECLCDPDDVLSEDLENLHILFEHKHGENDTSCNSETNCSSCNLKIVVAFVKGIEGGTTEEKEDMMAKIAETLHKNWGMSPCASVLVVSDEDRIARPFVGEKAQSIIVKECEDDVFKFDEEKNYAAMLRTSAVSYREIINGDHSCRRADERNLRNQILIPIILLISAIIISIVVAILLITYRKRSQASKDITNPPDAADVPLKSEEKA